MASISYPLIELAHQLNRTIIPMIIFIGIGSNTLNIIILTQTKFSRQSCSRYFLANAISNLFYSSIVLTYRLLADDYRIDPARISIVWCKIFEYFNHLGIFLSGNFLVLASIDRWCASSSRIQFRKFCHIKIAHWLINLTILFFAIFFINSIITVDLRQTGCSIRADTTYKQIYVLLQSSIISLLCPCLMSVFGLMTISNIKNRRVLPIAIASTRRTESELVRMLLLQIGIYVLLSVPSSISYLIFVLPNDLKITSEFFFAAMISLLLFHLSYTTPFFLYILSGRIYRKELRRFFRSFGINRISPL